MCRGETDRRTEVVNSEVNIGALIPPGRKLAGIAINWVIRGQSSRILLPLEKVVKPVKASATTYCRRACIG